MSLYSLRAGYACTCVTPYLLKGLQFESQMRIISIHRLGMSRLIGMADKSADIWRFQNNR